MRITRYSVLYNSRRLINFTVPVRNEVCTTPNISYMEFKHEELVEREVIIARLLAQGFTGKEIAHITGMGNRIVTAHIRNMKVKLQVKDLAVLVKLLQQQPGLINRPG